MAKLIRTLRELEQAIQDLIDSSGKRVHVGDLEDVLDRVVTDPPPPTNAVDPPAQPSGTPTPREKESS